MWVPAALPVSSVAITSSRSTRKVSAVCVPRHPTGSTLRRHDRRMMRPVGAEPHGMMSGGNELLHQLHAERSERQARQMQFQKEQPEPEPEPEPAVEPLGRALHVLSGGGTRSWSGAEVSVSRCSSLFVFCMFTKLSLLFNAPTGLHARPWRMPSMLRRAAYQCGLARPLAA